VTSSPSLSFSSHRPKRRRWVRVVVGLLAVALLLVVLVALSGTLLWTYSWARLGGTSMPALTADDVEALGEGGATAPDGTTTVLVALTGPREGDDTEPVQLAGPVALVQVGGPRGDDPVVLLLPDQLPISVEGGGPQPLRQVHATGGPDLLVRSVVDYTQVEVDHVVTAAVDAVPRLVDALGPVEICTTDCREVDADEVTGMVDRLADDGTEADEVATAAVELAAVIGAIGADTDPLGLVVSPLATKRAIDVLATDVTTDVSLRGAAALPVLDRLAAVGDVTIVQLPGVLNPDSGELLLFPEQAATRFAVLREGGIPTETPEDDRAELLAAASVAVQNGTGTAGYAARLEAQLAAAGVRVVGTENAPSFEVERTQVAYGPEDPAAEAAAILLARELGDVDLVALERQPTFEGSPVTVLVIGGADLDTEQEP
jgi:hypothetical protein